MMYCVKVYLRQTSGDIVFKAPDTRGFDLPQVVTGEEDEGFQDDWLSNLYGRGHRASTGSTMSSHSTGTNITWSSHSSSAGNLKASTSDISKEPSTLFLEKGGAESEVKGAVGGALEETMGVAVGGVSRGDESGSEETVVEQCPSQITVGTLQTNSSKNKSESESESSLSSSNETTPPLITELVPPTPTNEEDSRSERLTNSFRDLRHSPGLRKQEREGSPLGLLPPPMRRPKLGPSVQGSRITASFSSGSHRRQASMGGGGSNPQTPSPLIMGNHKRHSSVSVLSQREYLQDAASLSSNKTKISVLSTLEQSRVDTESLVNQLIANHDLTPASDDEGQSNLKLYVDRHSGGVTLAGHDLDR
uniref:Uncharacterized protein n=2 Tax=Amphimedon queenslandica TaxID=400682 RepID=A0A1X7SQ49_AMPQE